MEPIQCLLESFIQKYPFVSMEEMLSHELCDVSRQDPIWKMIEEENKTYPVSKNLVHLFLYVRNLYRELYHAIEGKESCAQKTWQAHNHNADKNLNGGGVMNVIRDEILEKAAVNMSIVHGPHYPAMEGEYAGKPFVAGGVSLITHPKNPNAPTIHMNIRCIKVTDKDTGKVSTWIGGGADLTPMVSFEEDTHLFHSAMKSACEKNPQVANYDKYQKWADEYFYIPHRKQIRGVGGIFFDFVPLETEQDLSFLLDVGQKSAIAYAQIMAKRKNLEYNDELLEKHLYWRGRYAEFNLIYDRGTRFGLLTGGNSEAILCSLPPTVKW